MKLRGYIFDEEGFILTRCVLVYYTKKGKLKMADLRFTAFFEIKNVDPNEPVKIEFLDDSGKTHSKEFDANELPFIMGIAASKNQEIVFNYGLATHEKTDQLFWLLDFINWLNYKYNEPNTQASRAFHMAFTLGQTFG
ncbi:hypothetical protein KFE98_01635 [bacterium SCSIO 12741]|nr:hypothetical protein KFE98_01635 [bacterium SCSIO 12741]